MLYGCTIYTVPIRCSSTRPNAFRRSDFSPWAAASCLNPCSMVARHKRFLTLVSRFRPFACWPPSQPSYASHPHHGPLILRSHDTRGSRHRFQRQSLRFSAALLPFLRLPPTSLLAVTVINSFRLHVTRGSRHRFQPRPFAFWHPNHHPAPSFTQALSHPAPAPSVPSPSSPDHDLHYQYPNPPPQWGGVARGG